MGEYADTITRGGRMSLWLAEQMLKDVKPAIFARKPSPGGKVIETNHGAFIFGHLTLYPAKWMAVVGLDGTKTAAPAEFEGLFGAGKECRDDPEGVIYPPMEKITSAFFASHKTALGAIPILGDDVLHRPNPREGRLKEMFPTIGGVLIFYTSSHMMMHLGQMSAWRRCFGLGPVM